MMPLALIAGLGAAAGLLWLRRAFLVVTVTGRSMVPTFQPGDRVLARRGPARTGDVVIVGPGHLLIKRLAAMPGEPVPRERVPALANVRESTVPPGKMVLLGDGP